MKCLPSFLHTQVEIEIIASHSRANPHGQAGIQQFQIFLAARLRSNDVTQGGVIWIRQECTRLPHGFERHHTASLHAVAWRQFR